MADVVKFILTVDDKGVPTLRAFNKELDKQAKKGKRADAVMKRLARRIRGSLTPSLTQVKIAALAATAAIIGFGARFEKSISRLSALTGATGKNLLKLEKTALRLGQTTVFSASEAASAMTELGKVGFDVNQILAATGGLLDLAAASGEDLTTTTEILAGTLKAFSIDASESGRVGDVLADSFCFCCSKA